MTLRMFENLAQQEKDRGTKLLMNVRGGGVPSSYIQSIYQTNKDRGAPQIWHMS